MQIETGREIHELESLAAIGAANGNFSKKLAAILKTNDVYLCFEMLMFANSFVPCWYAKID